MNIAVIGSRQFKDYEAFKSWIDLFAREGDRIVSGGAVGADLMGKRYAEENNLEYKDYLPDWKKFGKSAGFRRNVDIVTNSDIVIAAWDGISSGTKNSLDLAASQKKPTFIYYF